MNCLMSRLSRRGVQFAVVTGCLALTTGCLDRNPSAGDQHQCAKNGGINPFTGEHFDPKKANRPSEKPILKIVEFTDEGEIADRCQWSDVFYEVRGASPALESKRSAKLIVMYVHGWKHNADTKDEDLGHFRDLVTQLQTLESHHDKPRDVIGIYLAWPGKALDIPVLDNLSFWGRKGGADRVTSAGNVSKLISSIKSVSCHNDDPDDFIVGIGHSFGARILYAASAPLLINELAMKHPGARFRSYDRVDGNIDLTILLNPAFEASRYTALDASRRNQESFAANQQPLLLSIATTNDSATQYAFPMGQVIGTRWKERERTTLGNYMPYRTHELFHDTAQSGSRGKSAWYDDFCQSGLCLAKKDDVSGYPFLVASTDSSVLDGHNGIWSKSFSSWLADFVEVASEKRLEDGGIGRGCPLRQPLAEKPLPL